MISVDKLPSTAFRPKTWTECWTLSERKRKFQESNCKPYYGMDYWIYSFYTRKYYKRDINEFSDLEQLKRNIGLGIVWLDPNDEIKDKIRADVQKSGEGYKTMQLRRYYEYMLQWTEDHGQKNYNYQTQRQKYIDKLKSLG